MKTGFDGISSFEEEEAFATSLKIASQICYTTAVERDF